MNFPLHAPRMRAAARRAKAGGERFLGGVLPGATARRLQVAAFADEWAAGNLDARQGSGPLWIVLGDSISQGIGATTRESGYVGVMHEMLRRRDAWRVINLSRAEAGVLDVLARQLPELNSLAANHEIALVTCIIGAEDMARRTPGLDTALRQVISALPTGSVIGLLPHGPRAAGTLNSVIREEAERHAMRIAVLPPRLPGQIRGRDNRGLGDVGHAAWARAVLTAADGPVAVAAPATDPRLPIVPPLEDDSPPTDPRMPVVPPLDPAGRTDRLTLDPSAEEFDAPVVAETDVAPATALEEPVVHEPVVQEPVLHDPVVQEPVVHEPVVQEPFADGIAPVEPIDDAVAEDLPADEPAAADQAADGPVVEQTPVVETPVVGSVVEEPAVREPEYRVETHDTAAFAGPTTDHDDLLAGSTPVEELVIAEAARPRSTGWAAEFGTDVEPVAGIEPVADDEPLEVEVDTVGDPAVAPADDLAEPTAVEPAAVEPAAVEAPASAPVESYRDRYEEAPAAEAPRPDRPAPAPDVDLFAPTPPADEPRTYGGVDRGPDESGADRTPGYAERADRR